MNGRRVVAVTDGTLLTVGVLSVLREQTDIDLVTVDRARGQIYRKIREIRPEVVLIGADRMAGGGLTVRRILHENPRSTVVALSLDPPEIEVFDARQVNGATVDDLLRVLHEGGTVRRPARAEGSSR